MRVMFSALDNQTTNKDKIERSMRVYVSLFISGESVSVVSLH